MAKPDTSPRLKPDDMVRFLDDLRPDLAAGNYTVEMRHAVPTLGIDAVRHLPFTVAGPRFQLLPSDIAGQFPPPGASGDFGAVLPHVSLARGTLPWERHATVEREATGDALTREHAEVKDAPSWLALIVLDADEAAGIVSTVKAGDLLGDPGVAPGAAFSPLRAMAGDDPEMPVKVIDLPAALAMSLLPRVADLPFLASARQVNDGPATGVVMATRLPKPRARNTVHVVSVEHQYVLKSGADRRHHWTATHEHWSAQVAPGAHVRLISLHSWDFFCSDARGDLAPILAHLVERDLRHPAEGLADVGTALLDGFSPVEHRLRDGQRTAAWYRGPFQTRPRKGRAEVPVRRADDLLRREGQSGMTDISLSAAWQLGRLLALGNATVSSHLAQWKRRVAHAGHAARDMDLADALGHAAPVTPQLPGDVRTWFAERLGRLHGVPFDYLVPEAALFPPESIAWFRLDPGWMAALFDGAFSIGRESARQLELDRVLRGVLPAPAVSGVLLRSEAVRGWPGLIVDARAGGEEVHHPVRYDRLGPDTLLALFDVRITRVSLHPPLQALHFGLDGTQESGLSKKGLPVVPRDGGLRVINIADLAGLVGGTGAHDFSRGMIEGVPKETRGLQLP